MGRVRLSENFYERMVEHVSKRRLAIQTVHQKMRRSLFTKKLHEIRENLNNMPVVIECNEAHDEPSVHDHNLEESEEIHEHSKGTHRAQEQDLDAIPDSATGEEVFLSVKNIILLQNKEKKEPDQSKEKKELDVTLKLDWNVRIAQSNKADKQGQEIMKINKNTMGTDINKFPLAISTRDITPIVVRKGRTLCLTISDTESNAKQVRPLECKLSYQEILNAKGSYELYVGIDDSRMEIIDQTDKSGSPSYKRIYLIQFVEDLSKDHTLNDRQISEQLAAFNLSFIKASDITQAGDLKEYLNNNSESFNSNAWNTVDAGLASRSNAFRGYLGEFYDQRWKSVERMMEVVQLDSWKKFEVALEKYLEFDKGKGEDDWGCLIKNEKKLDQVLQELKANLAGKSGSNDSELSVIGNTKLLSVKKLKRWTFLYFSREKWNYIKNNKGTYDPKAQELKISVLKADFFKIYISKIKVGCPKALCLHVWKSLGKAPLLIWNCDYMIEQYVKLKNIRYLNYSTKSQMHTYEKEDQIFEKFAKVGNTFFQFNNLLVNYMESYITNNLMDAKKERYLRRLVSAYLAYSYISKESKLTFLRSGNNQRNDFGLKISNEIIDIASNLIDLQFFVEKHYDEKSQITESDKKDSKPNESDSFWVLLGIALTFLPEHFYQPIISREMETSQADGGKSAVEDKAANKSLKELGFDFTPYRENYLFYKTFGESDNNEECYTWHEKACIIPRILRYEDVNLYQLLENTGFNLLEFATRTINCLFTNVLNQNTLFILWN